MIHLITNQKELFDRPHNSGISLCSLNQAYEYLIKIPFIGFDSETMGLDHHTKPLICIQLGDYKNQYVIDTDTVNYKPFLEKIYKSESTIIMHNAAFDLRFTFPLIPRKLVDTFLNEAVLNRGDYTVRKSLEAVTRRYIKVDLDKSIRGSIHREGLSDRVIRYSADDVKYLELILQKQNALLKEKELTKYAALENRFVIPLAYTMHCGFYLDKTKWGLKCKEDDDLLDKKLKSLDSFVVDNCPGSKFIDNQLDLFKEGDDVTCNVLWSSSQQVIKLFEHLKIPVDVYEKGKVKKSIDQKHITKYKDEFELVKLYLSYSKQAKLVSTYGYSFLRNINLATNRIHTTFNQILDTGRISSGKKSKRKTDQDYPNLQNIPRDNRHRGAFSAQFESNTLVVGDYSGQEQIVLANKSLEPNLIAFYQRPGKNDMHSYVAKLCFPDQLLDTLESEVKDKFPELRYLAKTAGFSINYGGVGLTIARNANVSLEVGNSVYKAYFEAFPKLRDYFNKVIKETFTNGYITCNAVTNSKTIISDFDIFLRLHNKIHSGDTQAFWENYKKHKKADSLVFNQELKPLVRQYYTIKGGIERNSLNYPIQGTSAEMTKIAAIYFFDWIIENNYFEVVKLVNLVHDEIACECPVEIAELVSINLKECMERAGRIFCTTIPIKAEPKITFEWDH